jgi:hypothetical protein
VADSVVLAGIELACSAADGEELPASGGHCPKQIDRVTPASASRKAPPQRMELVTISVGNTEHGRHVEMDGEGWPAYWTALLLGSPRPEHPGPLVIVAGYHPVAVPWRP